MDKMKCPGCGNELVEHDCFVSHDLVLDADVRTDGKWLSCGNCGWDDLGWSRTGGDDFNATRQELIERWIAGELRSFGEIRNKFVSRSMAMKMANGRIAGYDGKPLHGKRLYRHLEAWCFHFTLFGREYFLKRSVKQCAMTGNGLWRLEAGLEGE